MFAWKITAVWTVSYNPFLGKSIMTSAWKSFFKWENSSVWLVIGVTFFCRGLMQTQLEIPKGNRAIWSPSSAQLNEGP